MDNQNDSASLLARALAASWQLSASIAVIALVVSFVVLPAISFVPIVSRIFLPMAQSFSILVAAFFVMIALAKLWSAIIVKDPASKSTKLSPKSPQASSQQSSDLANPLSLLSDNSETPDLIRELWTLDLLTTLDQKRFEGVCSDYFTAKGMKNKPITLGVGGGIDLWLYENNPHQPTAAVQCKQNTTEVGVRLIREFLGAMHQAGVTQGYYVTTNKFNRGAVQLASAQHIELIDGKALICQLKQLPDALQRNMFDRMTSGDFTIPTCVKCGQKMVQIKFGEQTFWGCRQYPRCRGRMRISARPKAANIARR